jgi:hypothetical protein
MNEKQTRNALRETRRQKDLAQKSFGSTTERKKRGTSNPQEMIGQRFGRLVVLSIAKDAASQRYKCKCQCDCGEIKFTQKSSLLGQDTQSCGCLNLEKIVKRSTKHGHAKGGILSPAYRTWRSIENRVFNKRNPDYPDYGGRGITMDERWKSFNKFHKDMGDRPEGMCIGRIDNDGPYTKGNCRWETQAQQANNRRSSRRFFINGISKTLAEWENETGIKQSTISYRIKHGVSPERVINPIPLPKNKQH